MALLFALLSGGSSEIRRERRLPEISDSRLFAIQAVIGAAWGLLIAALLGFQIEPVGCFLVAIATFLRGVFYGFNVVTSLNNRYLSRAVECFEQGLYREAIDDAKEVARSSERLCRCLKPAGSVVVLGRR